jgi:hypothetical protein
MDGLLVRRPTTRPRQLAGARGFIEPDERSSRPSSVKSEEAA